MRFTSQDQTVANKELFAEYNGEKTWTSVKTDGNKIEFFDKKTHNVRGKY